MKETIGNLKKVFKIADENRKYFRQYNNGFCAAF